MYKINAINPDIINFHLDHFLEPASRLMVGFRDGELSFKGQLGRKNVIKLTYLVIPGSPTWKFLDKYSSPSELKKLLCGSWNDLLQIVADVDNLMNGDDWKCSLTKSAYEKEKYQGKIIRNGNIYVDSFNDIIKHIFVDELYEHYLDKFQFVKSMNLKVCPYCGRQKINVASIPGRRDSKPPIDHFLPKSKYPFLAVSLYNMIPCCTVCNDISNKGDFDPLDGEIGLENPHEFSDDHVKFDGIFPDLSREMDENEYDVNMIFNPQSLAKGYRDNLKLEAFYRDEKQEMMDMYSGMIHFSKGRKEFLKVLGVDENYMGDIERSIVGFPLDGKVSVRLLYKFKKELFEKLLKMFPMSNQQSI